MVAVVGEEESDGLVGNVPAKFVVRPRGLNLSCCSGADVGIFY